MKKLMKSKNLGWIIALTLFLILIFKTNPENKKIEVEKEKIETTITIIPTKIVTPTENGDLISVTKVIDGDTLIVNINDKEESIRLIGIDTPEINDKRKKVKCFGEKATERVKELVENKKIRLEVDESQENKDIYSRLLRYIYLEDGIFLNKKLIEEGFAFEYTYKIPYKFQTEFKAAQKMAEEEKIGMWADDACPIVDEN
jgi:micrococcal nuclease